MTAIATTDFRKPYLDGLRGCAAIVVLFNHLAITFNSNTLQVVFNGQGAVCVFFVLSGYVLTDLARRSKMTFPAQALRRYIRLVIPILITSIFAWALLFFGLYKNQEAASVLGSTSWLGRWYNFEASFANMIIESVYGIFATGESIYNCNLWTMRPELIGSLYIFVVNATAPSRSLRVACYFAFALFFASNYIPLFAFGALLCEFHSEISELVCKLRDKAPIATMIALPLIFAVGIGLCIAPEMSGNIIRRFINLLNRFWHMSGAIIVVAAVLHWPLAQHLFGSRAGRFLGRISFVLYLIQIPIICSFTCCLFLTLAPALDVSMASKISAITTVALTIIVSALTCKFIDEIPTRFSRAVGYWIDATFSRAAPQRA